MKKIKGLLFAFVALFAFTLAMVTVKAAGEKYGVYTVSEAGKKAEWDFTQNAPGSNYKITTISDEAVYGIGGANDKVQFKSAGNLSNAGADGANIYIPVPSADAAGSISFVGNDNSRYVELTQSGGTKIYALKSGENSTPFTSADISESAGHYYLTLVGSSDGKELKATKITVTLTSGEYELTAAKITVTLKDSDEKVLRSDATVDSGSAYKKGYVAWGFDTTGYFLDKELTQAYENSELTEDTTLYVGLNAWDGVIANPNNLTNELVAKLNGVELGDTYPLTGTIYTLLPSTGYATTSGNPCININGAVDKTQKGVQVIVEAAGTLEVEITSGGTSARNAKVVNATSGTAITATAGNASWDADAAKAYEVRTLKYDLEAGTYNVGGDNGMRILSMNFVPAPMVDAHIYQQEGTKDDTTFVRYITIVNGIDAEDLEYTLHVECEDVSFDANCVVATKLLNNGEVYVGEIDGGASYTFDEKDGTLYIICVLAVKNAEHQEFAGKEITATMTVNGATLAAKVYTISE